MLLGLFPESWFSTKGCPYRLCVLFLASDHLVGSQSATRAASVRSLGFLCLSSSPLLFSAPLSLVWLRFFCFRPDACRSTSAQFVSFSGDSTGRFSPGLTDISLPNGVRGVGRRWAPAGIFTVGYLWLRLSFRGSGLCLVLGVVFFSGGCQWWQGGCWLDAPSVVAADGRW